MTKDILRIYDIDGKSAVDAKDLCKMLKRLLKVYREHKLEQADKEAMEDDGDIRAYRDIARTLADGAEDFTETIIKTLERQLKEIK